MPYMVKIPWWIDSVLYRGLTGKMPVGDKPAIYLTFDDGPHEKATPFVLDALKEYEAEGTFFCIGKNVEAHPDIYRRIRDEGHTVGNHTQNHLNGWQVDTEQYLDNIQKAAASIHSRLFRPPYGRIRQAQIRRLKAEGWQIYIWDVLSGDFDRGISGEQCLDNVLKNIEPGSIVVFHDSEKAWERMSYALPRVLAYCKEHNLQVKALPQI